MKVDLTVLENFIFLSFVYLCRASALMMVMPVFGSDFVPKKIKIVLSSSLAFFLFSQTHQDMMLAIKFSPVLIFREIMIGLFIGFTAQIIFQAIIAAGEIISSQSSLSFASFLDPSTRFHIPILSEIYQIFFFLVYLSMNGHMLLFEVLLQSFRVFPINDSTVDLQHFSYFIGWTSWIFKGGVLAALPIMISLLVVNISLGIITKAVPQINVLSVGFPIYMIFLFLFILLSLNSFYDFFEYLNHLLFKELHFLV